MDTPLQRNRLLALLPEADYQALVAQADTVTLEGGAELYASDGPIEDVYFPLTLLASTLVGGGNSHEVDLAIIGNEGMLGSTVVLDVSRAWGRHHYQSVRPGARAVPDAPRSRAARKVGRSSRGSACAALVVHVDVLQLRDGKSCTESRGRSAYVAGTK